MDTYFGPLEDVAFGIGDKFDYDKFKLWIERQQLNFSHSVTIGGDLISANWDGASPLDLSAVDTTATAGFAQDSSEGSAQFMGDFWVGGDLTLIDGKFQSGLAGTQRLSISAGGSNVEWVDTSNVVRASINTVGSGASTDLLLNPTRHVQLNTGIALAGTGVLTLQSDDDDGAFDTELRLGGTYARVYFSDAQQYGFDSDGAFFNKKIQTGQSSFTREPWAASSIALGNFGSIGSQGSFRLSMAWNYERGTDSAWYSHRVNSFDEAGGIEIGSTGILFRWQDAYSTSTTSPTTEPTAVAQIVDGGSGSYLRLMDGLTDVGNHETLRLNRGSGTTLQSVGYYSSWEFDPVTGRRAKKNFTPLSRSPKWKREWFKALEPTTFIRTSTKQREFGFRIESFQEIDDNLKYLTTKGDQWGHGLDEFGLIAVTVDYVQHLERRVAELEKQHA